MRKSVAEEVDQLLKQSLAIGNRKIGNRYLFGGHATQQRPFDGEGNYLGDRGHRFIEIRKDFFVPINLTGAEIFFSGDTIEAVGDNPLKTVPLEGRGPVEQGDQVSSGNSLFDLLRILRDSMRNRDLVAIRTLLDGLDRASSRLTILRTQIGATHNSIINTEAAIGGDNIAHIDRRSKIEDADVINLFSELEKQNNVLEASYKSGASLVNKSLLDFL